MTITVGVLAIQGDVAENIAACQQAIAEMGISGEVIPIKTSSDIQSIDTAVIPGGESTTIGHLSLAGDTMASLADRIRSGMPTLGICAGLILLSSTVTDRNVGKTNQPLMSILDVRLERNSFGRQRRSFESTISMEHLGIEQFHAVFIRAPSVLTVGTDEQVIGSLDGRIVAVQKKAVIGTAFHPELAGDTAIHRALIQMARR